MNIPKYADELVKEMLRRNYSKSSAETYRSNIALFLDHFKSKEHPKHINETDIKSFLGRWAEPNTQRSYHSAIKLFFDICMGQKEKFKYIPYASKSEKLPVVLSVGEIQRMFDVCENTKHKVILALLYSCGLRIGELISLKWKHIDRERMIVNVIQAKGKKDRQVGLPEHIIPLLEKYWKEYKSKEYVLNGWKDEPQYTQESARNVIHQLASKAGIKKKVYPHLIRHCYATHLVEAGTDINLIQKVLGHASVKTTNIYLHISHNHISKMQSPVNAINL